MYPGIRSMLATIVFGEPNRHVRSAAVLACEFQGRHAPRDVPRRRDAGLTRRRGRPRYGKQVPRHCLVSAFEMPRLESGERCQDLAHEIRLQLRRGSFKAFDVAWVV